MALGARRYRAADSAAQRVVARRAGRWRYCGTVNWTRCATHLYVVAEGVLTCARRHLSRVLPRRTAAAMRRAYAVLHRRALRT